MSKFDGHTDLEIDLLFRGSYRPTMENNGLIYLTCSPAELPERIRDLQEAYDEVEAELQRRAIERQRPN